MMLWMKAKLTTIMIATVAVFALAGAGAVFAAQNHASNTASTPHTADGASSQQEHGFEAEGLIQQVAFDQGTTKSGSLVFLPDGKQDPVTVTFSTTTEMKFAGDSNSSSEGQNANSTQPGTLQAGMHAKVTGAVQTDGSVLANEIQVHAQGANGNNDDDGNDDHGNNDEQELVGVIQSVDQNVQTFVLLPDGQMTPVTIAFDAKTNVEDEHDDGGNNAGLVAGAHVRVETITQSDGSLYAKEIKPAADNEGDGGQEGNNNGGDGDGHNGQPTPTPGPGGGDHGGDQGGSGSGNSGH